MLLLCHICLPPWYYLGCSYGVSVAVIYHEVVYSPGGFPVGTFPCYEFLFLDVFFVFPGCVLFCIIIFSFFVSFGLFHVLTGIILCWMRCCASFTPFPFSGVLYCVWTYDFIVLFRFCVFPS